MQAPAQPARPRHRSAFGAAFLSLIFPGLGHLYAGALHRALAFASVPFLLIALTAGLALSSGVQVFGAELVANLPFVLLLNIAFLAYRIVAAVDAYRVAIYLNAVDASGGGRLGMPRIRLDPLSLAGLLAVCLVIVGGHGVVAYYGTQAQDTLSCIFDPSGDANCDSGDSGDVATAGASASATTSSAASAGVATGPTASPDAATPLPTASIPAWNGKDRLNILLVGVDQRPKEGTFNTDTLIVVSIDPVSKQVAMFSLPRDTVDVPIPSGPARSVFGSVYGGKINSLYTNARNQTRAFPGSNTNARGMNALKSVLGSLYGLDIQYYARVNFAGFENIVDTLGGVTINVQNPVLDDHYPGDDGTIRVYIPAGVQHMDGAQALVYARSRHTSNDFDRAQRQQRVILSLREQADPKTILDHLSQLLGELKKSFTTDIPQSKLPQLIGLSSQIDSTKIRSYVFTPPFYGSEGSDNRGYRIEPNVTRIRRAVSSAFKVDPQIEAQREKIAGENGVVWVVNGTGRVGQASGIASYLEYLGLTASAPTKRPDRTSSQTKITVYNGRETELPATIALLENVFNVKVTTATDPSVLVDIIVTTGTKTPNLTPPPGP